ncbi:MAG: hypothetical protein ACK5YR_00650 [Pirellula sp.]|jgi:hypothetical protein
MSRPHILVIVEGNRHIRFIADGDVRLQCVQVPFHTSCEGERLVEEYLRVRLPPFWLRVFDWGHNVGLHNIRDTKAVDIICRDLDLALLATLNRIEVKE